MSETEQQRHVVSQGECLNSIAADYGFHWETIWNHAANSALKQRRQDPSVLEPGDELTIPDKRERYETRSTEAKHRFRKRGTPAKVKIQVKRNDEPRANQPYRLIVDGKPQSGTTDGQGFVEMQIPPNANRGELHVGPPEDTEVFHFQLGTVDPIETEDGVRGRLQCLGYDPSQPLDELLREFQAKEQLEQTGRLDQATQDRIKQRFGE